MTRRYHPSRYIPPDARPFTRTEDTDATICCYEQAGRYGLLCYHGKANKPDIHIIYRTAQARADEIRSFIAGRRSHAEYMTKPHEAGRPLSEAAKAAAEIRAKLKAAHINAAVRSKNFSMGNDVNIDLTDEPPWVVKQVEKLTAQYEMGHLDGMTDMYEYSNSRNDIPQTKYLFVNNSMTDAMRDQVYEFLRSNFASGNDLPDNRKEAESLRFMDAWVSDWIHRLFSQENSVYWKAQRQLRAVS